MTITAIEVNVDGIQKIDLASVTCASDGDGGGGTTTPTTTPTTSRPSAPTGTKTTSPSVPVTSMSANVGGSPASDRPDANGMAPVPTPVKAHLDVTG